MLVALLAESPIISIDSAALITSATTLAVGVGGAILKGSTMLISYLQKRDTTHDEAMATSMKTILEIQRDTIRAVERVTVAVTKLEEDFEADRQTRRRE